MPHFPYFANIFMLKKLHIKNYAIIDDIELDFSNGFTIITGETGAGKSILMGALGLILGDRADSSSLLNMEKKSFIEGFFSKWLSAWLLSWVIAYPVVLVALPLMRR